MECHSNGTLRRMLRKTRAYTLIELTVVVFLIGIMLALAVPRVQYALLSDDLKAATRRIVGAVRTLRDKAIREQRTCKLHFDIESSRFWEEQDSMTIEERAEARQNASRLPGSIRILDVCYRGAGKKDVGDTVIHFNRKGYVEPAMIHLGDKAGRASTVVLSPFLGTIKTYDKYVEDGSVL
ncbi:MAG: type II secretion system protein [Deltaproteobacteria bacterium]|nr:type II secretion system protein [Deltaproteobacteria bacterium]